MTKTTSGGDSSITVSCLLSALKEAQDSVRSYDTKAQIVGVGFIFTIGIITKLGANLPGPSEFNTIAVVLYWLLAIGPIMLFGFVLYPSRKTVKSLRSFEEPVRRTYYVSSESPRNLDAYLKEVRSSNWSTEIAYEIIKVSGLRDLKRTRFIRALRASAFSFCVVAFIQILRTMGFDLLGR